MTKKKKPVGRPPVKNPASEYLPRIRITPKQLAAYKSAAKEKDKTVSNWVRDLLDSASG